LQKASASVQAANQSTLHRIFGAAAAQEGYNDAYQDGDHNKSQ
jgi:hypothetical protein